jgi:ribosomal protein S21
LQIIVRDNNIDQALKALKKKMQREGIFREMKLRGHYEKPSEKPASAPRPSAAIASCSASAPSARAWCRSNGAGQSNAAKAVREGGLCIFCLSVDSTAPR